MGHNGYPYSLFGASTPLVLRVALQRICEEQSSALAVFEKAFTGFTPEVAGVHHLPQQPCRAVLVVAKIPMHHLDDVEHDVQPDQVSQCQRADGMTHAQLHDGVDIFGAPQPLLQGKDRLINHGTQDAVGDKTGRVLRFYRLFAHLPADFEYKITCGIGCVQSPDHFQQRHQGNWVEKVHPDHFFGP